LVKQHIGQLRFGERGRFQTFHHEIHFVLRRIRSF
jgi:hypothetical protein